MSNPLEGQDFDVKMRTTEDLDGATVVLWYIPPKGAIVKDVEPTSINVSTKIITYRIDDSVAVIGKWIFGGEIINAAGDIAKIIHPIFIKFDKDMSL